VAGGEQRSRSGDGAVAEFYGSVALASGGRKEKGTGDKANGTAWEPGPASRLGEAGRPRRAHRRRTAATWPPLAGTRRASACGREGEGEAGRAARWAEREAGLAQQRLPLFYFFFEFLFSNSFLNSFGPI